MSQSQSQHSFFWKNINSAMFLFLPILRDIVLNMFSCDIISRPLHIFQPLINIEMHCQEECDLTVVIAKPPRINKNNINNIRRRVKRSTQHITDFPNLSMYCLSSLFVLSRAKIIIDICINHCTYID